MRGTVLEIRGDRCVVIKQEGSFVEIRNRNYAVGEEIALSNVGPVKYLSLAASVAIVCASFWGYRAYATPTSFVYMDVNPSVRLDLNRFRRVVDVAPLNADAERLLAATDVSRKSAKECMRDVVDACWRQRFLSEENADVEISVRTDDLKLKNDVEAASASFKENRNLAVSLYQIDKEENDVAIERHISARRLRVVRAYADLFGGSLAENMKALQGKTSDEIIAAIREYRRAQNRSPLPPRRLSPRRLDAIRAYSEAFGSDLDENVARLKGVSSDEIERMIQEAQNDQTTRDAL